MIVLVQLAKITCSPPLSNLNCMYRSEEHLFPWGYPLLPHTNYMRYLATQYAHRAPFFLPFPPKYAPTHVLKEIVCQFEEQQVKTLASSNTLNNQSSLQLLSVYVYEK